MQRNGYLSASVMVRRLFTNGVAAGLSDGQLLDQFLCQRDEAAFGALVERHGSLVLGVSRCVLDDPADTEDVFQAVFLVLLNRAESIRQKQSLAPWLYKVTKRVAQQANLDTARRRAREQKAGSVRASMSNDKDAGLASIVADEVDRLPEKYQKPIILCYFEDLGYREAAARLDWTEGMVRNRLAKAKLLLKRRIARKGMMLPAAAAILEQLRKPGGAAVPDALARTTLRKTLLVFSGQTSAPMLGSTSVAVWSHMAIQSMASAKLRHNLGIAATFLLATSVGLGVVAASARQEPKPGEKAASKTQTREGQMEAKPKDHRPMTRTLLDSEEMVEVSGKVLLPDGKPASGALLTFYHREPDPFRNYADPLEAIARTGPDGKFSFQAAKTEFAPPSQKRADTVLAASTPGFGPDWKPLVHAEDGINVTLNLVKDDVPIEGKIVDLEGKPIEGVNVIPFALNSTSSGDLSSWLESLDSEKKDVSTGALNALEKELIRKLLTGLATVKTGPDGTFRISGVGRERALSVMIQGDSITTETDLYLLTSPYKGEAIPIVKSSPEHGSVRIYGSRFVFAAKPSKPIVGTLKDQASGAPLVGVRVMSDKIAGNPIAGRHLNQTLTDAEGKFRLNGMPPDPGNSLMVSPGADMPYLPITVDVPASPGLDPSELDIRLIKGALIKGKVTDKITGKPVKGEVSYFSFVNNPNLKSAPTLSGGRVRRTFTDKDGKFLIHGLPGRGIVAVRAEDDLYTPGEGSSKIRGAENEEYFQTVPFICRILEFHSLVEVNIPENAHATTCVVELNPGVSVEGTVIEADGAVAKEVSVSGLRPMENSPQTLEKGRFKAVAISAEQPRMVLFQNKDKSQGAVLLIKGDEHSPLTVRLERTGSIVGKFIGKDGQPIANTEIFGGMDGGQFNRRSGEGGSLRQTTGKDGSFRAVGLIPGVKYSMFASTNGRTTGFLFPGLTIGPGETLDLGEVQAKLGKE